MTLGRANHYHPIDRVCDGLVADVRAALAATLPADECVYCGRPATTRDVDGDPTCADDRTERAAIRARNRRARR